MGINYHLLDMEKKEEERKEREEPKEERAAMLNAASPQKSEATENEESTAISLDDVAKMDEDTV